MKLVAKIDNFGRVLVPLKLRTELGLLPGAEVVSSLDEESNRVEISSRQRALRQAQGVLAKYKKPGEVWSEEVIEERRIGAARERDL